MTNLKENMELHECLHKYFEMHNANDTDGNLQDLLQLWLTPSTEFKRSKWEIANMVFFVSNLNNVLRNCYKLKNSSQLLTHFFDKFDIVSLALKLNVLLGVWIYAEDEAGEDSLLITANMVDAVNEITLLFFDLENELMSKEGLCA